jgi:hypothetical protein
MDKLTGRHTNSCLVRQSNKWTDKQMDVLIHMQMNRGIWIKRQTIGQIKIWMDIETYELMERQTDE